MRANSPLLFSVFFTTVIISIISTLVKWQFNESTGTLESLLGLPYEPDLHRNVTEIISSRGYPVEEHSVQTEDGFVLSMQRIPRGKKRAPLTGTTQEVVLMVHGLQSSSDSFLLNEPDKSLGFILSDAGFDVWLANVRGNRYSKRHVKYTTTDTEFWDFSFDEMGKFDLPAIIDYVLSVTSRHQLHYIGFSQGTVSAFAMLSEHPQFNQKIKLFVALAPVAFVRSTAGIPNLIFTNGRILADIFGPFEVFGSEILRSSLRVICSTMFRPICRELLATLGRSHMLNETRLGFYFSHLPSGTSIKAVAHFAQMMKSEKFCRFDYNKEKNLLKYGQEVPPQYNLSRVTVPTALFWSANDELTTEPDVAILRNALPNVVLNYKVPDKKFTHLDFMIGLNATELVYNEVLRTMESFPLQRSVCGLG